VLSRGASADFSTVYRGMPWDAMGCHEGKINNG